MSIIADLIVIAILILCIYTGYKKGLAKCLINVFSFIIAICVAFMLFKPVSNIVIDNTQFDENIQSSIVQVFEEEEKNEENKDEKKTESSPILEHISKEVEKATSEKKKEIVNDSAKKLSVRVINVLAFIVLFIATRIVLIFIKGLTNLITKLPLIKQCDKIGGVIYGALQGMLIIFIALALIAFISTISNKYEIMEIINNSYIASKLLNNNILLNVIF